MFPARAGMNRPKWSDDQRHRALQVSVTSTDLIWTDQLTLASSHLLEVTPLRQSKARCFPRLHLGVGVQSPHLPQPWGLRDRHNAGQVKVGPSPAPRPAQKSKIRSDPKWPLDTNDHRHRYWRGCHSRKTRDTIITGRCCSAQDWRWKRHNRRHGHQKRCGNRHRRFLAKHYPTLYPPCQRNPASRFELRQFMLRTGSHPQLGTLLRRSAA